MNLPRPQTFAIPKQNHTRTNKHKPLAHACAVELEACVPGYSKLQII